MLPPGEMKNDLSELLKNKYSANYLLQDIDLIGLDKISESERWADHGERSECLRHVLERYGLVDLVTPLHIPAIRREITLETTLGPLFSFRPPISPNLTT